MTRQNENGAKVRADRDETKTAEGSYYICNDCGYENTDILDVAEEPCWECGGRDLEFRSFVHSSDTRS